MSVSGNCGLVIIGEINCQPLKFFIDTGAGVTLISKGIFQQMSQGVEGSLQEVPFDVCGAGGSQLEVLGKDIMEITIGPLEVLHEVIVADIEADGILGIDFLSTHKCKVDLAGQHLTIHGMEVALWREGSQPQCCRITIKEDIVVPADQR